jgi:hypothetical protein
MMNEITDSNNGVVNKYRYRLCSLKSWKVNGEFDFTGIDIASIIHLYIPTLVGISMNTTTLRKTILNQKV